jgi:hypothetical protein
MVAGHSYGGQVMTALGTDAPNVAGLVYIAAFGLDQGESLGALLSQGPVTPALAHLITDQQGFGWLSEDDFVSHFAADVDPVKAKVMYAVQQALAISAFGDVMGVPAWKTLPSWYLVAASDQALPPDAERLFASRMGATTVEIPSSHLPMVSRPGDVAQLIKAAAEAVPAASWTGAPAHGMTSAPIGRGKRRTGITVAIGKEHVVTGARHDKRGNADLSGLRGADHRDGGQGHPAWPEPLNLEPDIGHPHLRPARRRPGRPPHDGRAGHGCG